MSGEVPKRDRVLEPESVSASKSGSFKTTAADLLDNPAIKDTIEKAARTRLEQDEDAPYEPGEENDG